MNEILNKISELISDEKVQGVSIHYERVGKVEKADIEIQKANTFNTTLNIDNPVDIDKIMKGLTEKLQVYSKGMEW
ncbi:hypothetical protein FDB15_18195 [Clostridium botulinum]|uniref:hypothetical protein n=1 Tax=unclassified Clostridium TaxID=2614128 RepID=UPI000540BF89|nr:MULTISPECIES: hypothetical protein [unclassified Clostridium]AIY80430.1 hypothetical protein U728_1669 [Clostridium botulinum 202F]KAI3345002.1 hypothetical protein CIT17_15415 [Clostridium botulinum]KON14088.1 hypothetical protein ACP50_04055 [Clostridium botulinum]MBY6986419.1 hypothetical protein [Clostridium botulinum]MBY7009063.1 hypothetical protein [Clostridium botulinum]